MLILLIFKKSLIVEQFQGNYADDNRIVSHDASRLVLYYHCAVL